MTSEVEASFQEVFNAVKFSYHASFKEEYRRRRIVRPDTGYIVGIKRATSADRTFLDSYWLRHFDVELPPYNYVIKIVYEGGNGTFYSYPDCVFEKFVRKSRGVRR